MPPPRSANMLYPKEDKENRVLLYACRNCEHVEQADLKQIDKDGYEVQTGAAWRIYRNEITQKPVYAHHLASAVGSCVVVQACIAVAPLSLRLIRTPFSTQWRCSDLPRGDYGPNAATHEGVRCAPGRRPGISAIPLRGWLTPCLVVRVFHVVLCASSAAEGRRCSSRPTAVTVSRCSRYSSCAAAPGAATAGQNRALIILYSKNEKESACACAGGVCKQSG